MTAEVAEHVAVPLYALPGHPVVAVIAEHDVMDLALAALVEKVGFSATIIDPDADIALVQPIVAIVRSAESLARVRSVDHLRKAAIAAIGNDIPASAGVEIISPVNALSHLQGFLAATVRPHRTQSSLPELDRTPDGRVHVTERELEVLTTYILGATIHETSRQHFIAESTVRAHYRRVTKRCGEAGQPVTNKAQLLLRLIADGWIHPRTLTRDPVGVPVLRAVPPTAR